MAPQIHMTSRGPEDGPPMLLVHGAWHASWCWEGILPALNAAGYRTHAPDLRGHGRSLGRDRLRWTPLRTYVDDTAAQIAALPEPPIVIAHSMGGFITQHLMARGLPMRGVALIAPLPNTGALPMALKTLRRSPATVMRMIARLSLYPMVENPDDAAHLFLDPSLPPEDVVRFHARLQDESIRAFLDMAALTLPGKPARPYPTLLLAGGTDTIVPPRAQARLARRLGTTAQVMPGAPHDLMLPPHADETATRLLDWTASLAPAARR